MAKQKMNNELTLEQLDDVNGGGDRIQFAVDATIWIANKAIEVVREIVE